MIESLLVSKKHVLDIGYDDHFKYWTAHLHFPVMEEGPYKGYTDGCTGIGDTPTAAMEDLAEKFAKHEPNDQTPQ